MSVQLQSVSENALLLTLGSSATEEVSVKVRVCVAAIENALGDELVDLVPAYASILIIYDPLRSGLPSVRSRIHGALQNLTATAACAARTVVLPVYYAPEAGDDIESLAAAARLSVADVIAIHTSVQYRVYAIGFAPGFAYLGQVDERIARPRLATPRTLVPRGAVGIADRQTAVYPASSPGGWNLIGRCPVAMFDPRANPCMPVAVGDEVRFEPIDRQRFLALGGEL